MLARHAHGLALMASAMGLGQVGIVLAIVASVTALTLTGHLPGEVAVGLYSAILGFVFGKVPTLTTKGDG